MQLSAVISASTALLSPISEGVLHARGDGSCDFGSVLEYLEALPPIPRSCHPELNGRATLYCSTFLGVQDTVSYTATVTPEVTQIALVYETALTSATDIKTTTTETTDRVLKVVTELATITTTTTEFLSPATTIIPTVTIFADPVTVTVTPLPLPNDQLPQIYARTWKPPSCNRIADGILAMNHAPYILEEACKCLELRPRTALLQSMAEPTTVTFTSTGTVTAFILESALLTAVSVAWESDISTTTSTITATETATVDLCGVPYSGSTQPGEGNTVHAGIIASTQAECCVLCQTLKNCVSFAWTDEACQLLIKTSPLGAASSNAQCPLGIETYDYGTINSTGVVFRGPCGVPVVH